MKHSLLLHVRVQSESKEKVLGAGSNSTGRSLIGSRATAVAREESR